MYARGLSVRDIEHTFTDRSGNCLLSKSAASELSERLWADYQAVAGRELAEHGVIYLFVDGIAERLHLGQAREAVLAGWGITLQGHKVLLRLAPGTKEDTVSCREFLRDLKARGLADPLLIATDGAPGLTRAVEEIFPRSLRQRCIGHKVRNLEAKVPAELWREVKARALAAYQAASPMLAEPAREEFVKRFERAVLKLMYATLIRASQTWRRVVITGFEQKQIEELRAEIDEEFKQRTASVVSGVSRPRIYSKERT